MEKSFWLKKWEENQIAFHTETVNDLLLAHIDKFNLQKDSNIFVPLCGKSIDLIYLAKLDNKVIGVELSKKAINSFFDENKLKFESKTDGDFIRYSCKEFKIDILLGDFFEIRSELIGPIDFIYDRASLIALPREIRGRYSEIMAEITKTNAQILLITTEYDHPEIIGPPFSIKEDEINKLYKDKFEIMVLDRIEKEIAGPTFQEKGVKISSRVIYKLIRK